MTETHSAPTATYPSLHGKVVAITGASRGIGAATATAFAANGAKVGLVSRDQAALDAVADRIHQAQGRALAVAADCTVQEELAAAKEQINSELGPVDVLVAFAGGYGAPVATSEETVEHWRDVLDGDLTTTFLAVSTFLPDLVASQGAIVTMASSSGRQPAGSSAAYAAAKAGVIGLSRHLAGELAAHGVRVNCVAPATVENERMRQYLSEERRQQMAAGFPLRRLGQGPDVAAATCFLASAASSWVTGITLDIAGGKVMP